MSRTGPARPPARPCGHCTAPRDDKGPVAWGDVPVGQRGGGRESQGWRAGDGGPGPGTAQEKGGAGGRGETRGSVTVRLRSWHGWSQHDRIVTKRANVITSGIRDVR